MKALIILSTVGFTANAMPIAVPIGFEMPKVGYSVEPFCTHDTLCVKEYTYRSNIRTADYEAIRETVSKYAIYKAGWLNSLDFIMGDIALFTSYRDGYGLTKVLLEKNSEGKWVVLRQTSAIF